VPVTTSTDQVILVTSRAAGPAADSCRTATLVLPSTMPGSAASSPGVTKPAGASPLVPSWRSAFSATGRGGMAPTSPYSDSAAVDGQRRVTSVRQMAQLFEEASSWQHQHHQLGVDLLSQSRQLAAERQKFTVNSQLFFFPISSSSSAAAAATATSKMTMNATSKMTDTDTATHWHKSSADLRLNTSSTTQPTHY